MKLLKTKLMRIKENESICSFHGRDFKNYVADSKSFSTTWKDNLHYTVDSNIKLKFSATTGSIHYIFSSNLSIGTSYNANYEDIILNDI